MKSYDRRRSAPARRRRFVVDEEEPDDYSPVQAESSGAGLRLSALLSFAAGGMTLFGIFLVVSHYMGQNASARSLAAVDPREIAAPSTTIVSKSSLLPAFPELDMRALPALGEQTVMTSAKSDFVTDDTVTAEPEERLARLETLPSPPPVWKLEKSFKIGQEEKQKALAQRKQRMAELTCLARAVYFEARSESELGQMAVAKVVLNRVKSPAYPKTICGVVYQGSERPNGCQFSFACDGKSDEPDSGRAWTQSRQIAQRAIAGDGDVKIISTATHYHADYVQPKWTSAMNRLIKIGRHVFYNDNDS